MDIRAIGPEGLEEAQGLVWEGFMRFVAPGYAQEGVETFRRLIFSQEFVEKTVFWGAYEGEELAGVIAMNRKGDHVNLFFVREAFQRRGIGRALWLWALGRSGSPVIRLNASPYGVPVYLRLGFTATGGEQVRDGIRYTPMEFVRPVPPDGCKAEERA